MKIEKTDNKIEERTDTKIETKKEKEVKDIIKGFVGKNVVVMLRGKNKLKGKLELVSQYELILTVSHKPVLVMKHAIDYIEVDDIT